MNSGKPKLICYSVCTDRTDMAIISYEFGGNAPAVTPNKQDKEKLKQAVKRYGATKLAKALGVGRSYIYDLLSFHRIELLRFSQLCKQLELSLLSEKQIDNFLDSLKERIY